MASGWVVSIELEAGRGELEPLLFIVALHDFEAAIEAAKLAPEVSATRVVLGDRAPPIHDVRVVHPVDAKTIERLGLLAGQVWNLYDPPLTDRISFAGKHS